MNQLFKKIYWSIIFVLILLFIVAVGVIISKNVSNKPVNTSSNSWSVINKVKDFSVNIFNPSPLRFEGDAEEGHLTIQGVLSETNRYRQTEGLKVLSFNAKLEQSAKAKLEDMFTRKYFAHISETGEGPGEIAASAEYEYIVVGENLALGNFYNDQELVKAWMDSPGHRANILNKNYRDIGIAVGKGMFEGRLTWLAVQEFGTPTSLCRDINKSQEVIIISNKEQLALWDTEIKEKYEILAAMSKSSSEYKSRATEYNELVDKYNNLSRRTKLLVSDYNEDVSAFNKCIKDLNL